MPASTSQARREELKGVFHEARACPRCPQLAATRTTVVFGSGNADADLMFVGEAPGRHEDQQGTPFVGQAGKLLDRLLGDIGLERSDVFVTNVLKCLRYTAMVQLGDRSWERIGRLVRTGYAGTVMSVDEDGQLVPRRVTGWHATPRGDRSIHRLTYRSAKGAGLRRTCVELTGDHPVLTERGFVPVEELRTGDRIATGQGLSALARDVVCGTLLGDGSIRAKSATLTISHSSRQAEYARFKMALLAELQPRLEEFRVAAVSGGERAYDSVQVRTLAHRALGVIRRDFYRPTKVVPDWIGDVLNPRMLAIWFMDDGHTCQRPGWRPRAEIATVSFSDDDLQVLLRGLRRLGLSAKASRRRLYFDAQGTRRLSELIAPFVPASMRHKLHPEVEAEIPYEPASMRAGAPEVLFDDVLVEDVSHRPHPDQTFFCIDVEGTNNFVTAGGVVHNCRPPGNRDPHPQEIENCQDYLLRQVELIEPRVVCTLGNFATKLLRGEPTGITRLHGRDEVRVIGHRAVRLYPLFHPAAALYTPANVDVLQADFRRLPELLAMEPPPQPEPGPTGSAGRRPEPEEPAITEPELAAASDDGEAGPPAPPPPSQLGLF